MESRKKVFETYLFSVVGVVAMAVLLIAVNMIADAFYARADMTEENLYTLSDGTRAILEDLDTPVTIRFYYSKELTQMPVQLKNYARRIEDLLQEYEMAADGRIEIQKFNPTPDSDAEDAAHLDGIYGKNIGVGEELYLGLAVSMLDESVALPFLHPSREDFLEYDITRAIYRVMHPQKPVVGIMSTLPVMGSAQPPMMQRRMPNQGSEPWYVITELKKDYDVREIDTGAEAIEDDVDLLMLVHPTGLSDKTLFAIDQYLLAGGKLMVFVDPMSMTEAESMRNNPMMMQQGGPKGSDLPELFDVWGINFDNEKIVADLVYSTQVGGRGGQPQELPTILSLDNDAFAEDSPITGQLDSVIAMFAGAFSGSGTETLEKTVLARTSEKVQLVDKFMMQMPMESIRKDFEAEDNAQALIVRLDGTFDTAFPEGPPANDDADNADENQENGEKADPAKESWLKTSSSEGAVLLVSDTDILADRTSVQTMNVFGGQGMAVPISDNLTLIQNAVDQFSGDRNLISIRSRGKIKRPFTEVNERQAEAEQRYQSEIAELEAELQKYQRKINELQRGKATDQKYILSPEQKETLEEARQAKAEARKDLKEVRKQLRRDIDALENKLKWANIGLIPLLVALGGLIFALVKRRRMSRK